MPTGYTAPIYEGEKDFTFEKFAMRCARNFGACIRLRGEPLTLDIDLDKHFQPNEYYKKRLEEIEKEYQEFLDNPPTEEQLGRKYDEMVEKEQKRFEERMKQTDELRQRYVAMLRKALEWNPPTPEHENLRNFMIQQLQESMDRDCAEYFPNFGTREEYIEYHLRPDILLERIKLYQEYHEREVKACNDSKQWVKDLMDSLNIK